MTAMYNVGSDNLVPQKSTDGSNPVSADTAGYTLAVATYYIPLASSEGPTVSECFLASFHVKWSAALAATITVESTNYPATIGSAGTGRADVTDWDTTAGNWIQENPTNNLTFSIGGAGNSVTAQTIVAGGTNAGAVIMYIANAAARRYRLKVVVTTGGTLRAGSCGKD